MKNLVILGAGTAGTMMANHLVSKLPRKEWKITIVDQYKTHYYQPGFLFLPFDIYNENQVKKEGKKFIPKGVNYIQKKIDRIISDENKISLEDETLDYDILIIATGSKIAPDEVEGMQGENWQKSVFDFYTYEGALALRNKLREWEGGKLVVHITEMPIKCPVAPLEFAFLADSYFKKKGMRDKVEITYVTPLSGAFTKEKCSKSLGYLLKEKNVNLEIDFAIERVDNENSKIIDYADKEVDFDLLVTVPTNMGDEVIERSGLGDDLNFVPTHHNTLQSLAHENIFVIGDASNVPASKAGSVAHFQAETLTDNILLYVEGKPLKEEFDGHANCFIETGENKALLIDFNYEHEPVEGTFPFAGIGPLKLLKESVFNHWGKLAFRWIYWNMLIKGIPIPFVSRNMSTKGKKLN
ncbi:type III sulfide quinone reductase, selenoprotein subtype [Seonamhaeicola maritimus]|uniref:type III sulfide quinone reductase, selenoprotein subtype n=1 Tax=Seonamhaeicola maritimus TaxID=2591822 RepID=UPI00249492C7|nr:FAD/NAD(P)-binding oxidoreductase [Seonamhaeicola maritimus]